MIAAFRPRLGLLALLAALSLSTAPQQGRAPAQLTNLGFAAEEPGVDAGFTAFLVRETAQGYTDLNGDGDYVDRILHLHDAVAGTTTNLGLAIANDKPLFHRGTLSFLADEGASGSVDLNGDGDTLDRVMHVRDLRTGKTTNLGLAGGVEMMVGEGVLVFGVSEFDQFGTDLNGDGDFFDQIVHVHQLASGGTTNTGLAGVSGYPHMLADGLLVIFVWEAGQGGLDLNADGDPLDYVAHVHHLASQATLNTGLAAWGGHVFPGRVAFAVSELDQGSTDLNGDGDVGDAVLFIYDALLGSSTNVGLPTWSWTFTRAGSHLAFLVNEFDQGGTDLNADGDASDPVLHVYDVPGATAVNLGLACLLPPEGLWADGERLAFPVWEMLQGNTDLNGDGDASDYTIHTYDPVRGQVRNLGLAGYVGTIRGRTFTFCVNESAQGSTDLNGDGDAFDSVFHEHDLLSGTTGNLGLVGPLTGYGSDSLLEVSEDTDLNGDGDVGDHVPHAHAPFAGAPQNLGLAGRYGAFDEGLQLMLAVEVFHGYTDLNGDGDAQDEVLFLVEPLYPFGLATDTDTLSIGAGGTQTFELDAGHAHGGEICVVLGSISGTTPGLWLGGFQLPLNYDPYFELTMRAPNAPPFSATLGVLDFMGEGQAALNLPPGSPPILTAIAASHAFVAIDPLAGWVSFVSNAVPLEFAP